SCRGGTRKGKKNERRRGQQMNKRLDAHATTSCPSSLRPAGEPAVGGSADPTAAYYGKRRSEAGTRRRRRLRRPAETRGVGSRRQRAGRQVAFRVLLVVGARRHIVRRIGMEQRSQQLDLPAAHAQL